MNWLKSVNCWINWREERSDEHDRNPRVAAVGDGSRLGPDSFHLAGGVGGHPAGRRSTNAAEKIDQCAICSRLCCAVADVGFADRYDAKDRLVNGGKSSERSAAHGCHRRSAASPEGRNRSAACFGTDRHRDDPAAIVAIFLVRASFDSVALGDPVLVIGRGLLFHAAHICLGLHRAPEVFPDSSVGGEVATDAPAALPPTAGDASGSFVGIGLSRSADGYRVAAPGYFAARRRAGRAVAAATGSHHRPRIGSYPPLRLSGQSISGGDRNLALLSPGCLVGVGSAQRGTGTLL